MEWSIESFVLVNFVLIVSSILQMVTGVSVGMIIVPILAMISYTLVPVPIIFASLTLTMLMAYQGREHIDIKGATPITIGMIFGIFIAIFVFAKVEYEYLGLIFGVLILLSVLISIYKSDFHLSKKANFLGGLAAGTMGAMAAVGGQILALLYQNHKLETIKATLALLYVIFSIVMLVVFYLFGQFSMEQAISGLYMIPGFLIGFLVAPYFTKYFNPNYAKPAVLLMATTGAVLLIGKSFL